MQKGDKVFIAGASGMVGSALVRKFTREGFEHLLVPTHRELELTDQLRLREYLCTHRPQVVVVAAAKVGGIVANNTFPAEFLYENLAIGMHLIHESHRAGVERLLYLGSSCIYPKYAPQPIPEAALLTGPLEPTNEAYAVAKIAALKLVEMYAKQYGRRYIAAMPTNLYGPNDNYHPEHSHVIPGLLRRFHDAKVRNEPTVACWGSGQVLREFLYVEDLAEALFLLLHKYEGKEHINVGSEEEVTIGALAQIVKQVVGYKGDITFDTTMPEGTPRKKCCVKRLYALGWRPQVSLQEGLQRTYSDFLCRLKSCTM